MYENQGSFLYCHFFVLAVAKTNNFVRIVIFQVILIIPYKTMANIKSVKSVKPTFH